MRCNRPEDYTAALRRLLAAPPIDDRRTIEVTATLLADGAVEDTLRIARAFARSARQALTMLPGGLARQPLVELADYAVRRQVSTH